MKKKTSDPDFDRFWEQYPQRVGKLKAQQAYAKAKKIARPSDILAGLERYRDGKPDWQTWAHASTWLNGQRWTDEYPARQALSVQWACPHIDHCSHRAMCDNKLFLGAEKYPVKAAS